MRALLTRPLLVAGLCAVVLAVAVEAAPVVGGDLIAQQWWASWAATSRTPVDLGWFGGVPVASYSLLSPWVQSALGLPLTGVLGTVLGAVATTALLGRLSPPPGRLAAAGAVAAAMWAADQWSGRTTFGTAAALGCLALVVASGPSRQLRLAGGGLLAVVAGAVSPLVSVFLLVAAAAWWLGAPPSSSSSAPSSSSLLGRLRSRPAGPWWVAAGALVPLAVGVLLGGVSGRQPASTPLMVAALAATGLTAAFLPPAVRVLRVGVAGTAAALLLTWLVSGPVGSNTTRLVLLFAAPILVAVARTSVPATALAVVGVMWLVPPVVPGDLQPRDPGSAQARADALLAELAGRGPVGRIEVVPMHGHQESLWVARRVPLARGWLRQLDTTRAGLFYDGTLDARSYLDWLRGAGVSYVALPGGALDFPARREAALLRQGVPGLREVRSDGWWRLFAVSSSGLVRGDAVVISSDRSRLVVDARSPGRVELAVWWSQWSSVTGPGGCVRPGSHPGWTALVVDRPGRYTVTSAWRPTGQCT